MMTQNGRDTFRQQQAAVLNQPKGESPWDSSQKEKNPSKVPIRIVQLSVQKSRWTVQNTNFVIHISLLLPSLLQYSSPINENHKLRFRQECFFLKEKINVYFLFLLQIVSGN